jgi:hypothetical protein
MTYTNAFLATAVLTLVGCGTGTVSDPSTGEGESSSNLKIGNTYFFSLKTTAGDHDFDLDDVRGRLSLKLINDAAATFHADIEFDVHGLNPNSTYTAQRASEVGRPLGADGICQRALGLYPWEQPNSPGFAPAPAYATFVDNAQTPPPTVVLTTNAWGAGSVKFSNINSLIAHGQTFDVVFRLADNPASPTSEVRSECVSVTNL